MQNASGSSEVFRYKAFISYAHADVRWATWLQRKLEGFRLPRRLVSKHRGSRRPLAPVFRDRSDLPAAHSLTEAVSSALAVSETLIVLCSPDAASSRWVNLEVLEFKRAGRGRSIFPIIVRGDPNSSDETRECFPPALKYTLDDEGNLTRFEANPLAADARRGHDGRSGALLKTIAGLLEIRFDDLKQRQQTRIQRQLASLAALGLGTAVVMGVLALNASLARQDAERRRAQAEDLIGFMLGDLRAELARIGSLDVLDDVGDKAMDYFRSLPEEDWDETTSLQRAMAIRQIGEVRKARGDMVAAAESFVESMRILELASAQFPDNADLAFEEGQAHFWLADIFFDRNEFDRAAQEIRRYRDIAEELSRSHPDHPDYRMEFAWAEGNLGAIAFNRGDYAESQDRYRASLEIIESLHQAFPDEEKYVYELAQTHSWLGSIALSQHRLMESLRMHERQLELTRQVTRDGDRLKLASLAEAMMLLATDHYRLGQVEKALEYDGEAIDIYEGLVAFEGENIDWQRRLNSARCFRARDHLALEQFPAALALLEQAAPALSLIASSLATDRAMDNWIACDLLLANYHLAVGDPETAVLETRDSIDVLMTRMDSASERTRRYLAVANYLLGEALAATGDRHAAEEVSRALLADYAGIESPDIELHATMIALRRLAGEDTRSEMQALRRLGFAVPRLWAHTPAAMAIRTAGE